MRLVGRPYGLNYGVSLPTLRRLARSERPDHAFAEYLYRQDVRELRLAALHIAEPDRLTPESLPFWGAGLTNNELSEEAAFALLPRSPLFPELYAAWLSPTSGLFCQYAALMAAARHPQASVSWLPPALSLLHRGALAVAGSSATSSSATSSAASSCPASASAAATEGSGAAVADPTSPSPIGLREVRLLASGVVALCSWLGSRDKETRHAVLDMVGSLGSLPAEDYVHEELAWRLADPQG